MHKYVYPLSRTALFCFLLTVVLTWCAQPLQAQTSGGEEVKTGPGVRVIQVYPGSQADGARIEVMDVLRGYGKFSVIDHSTYYKAREFYLKTPKVKVELEIWRGRTRLLVRVFPGTLGVDTNEYNPVAYQLNSIIDHIDGMQQIPDYKRQVEFKDEFEKESIDARRAKAKAMIDSAEAEGTLTPTQILVARISMIHDDAPAEELKKLDDLLAEFIRNQPPEYIGNLGERFKDKEHFRASRALLKQYLLTDPNNVSVRLNLGYASSHLGFWNEAEAAADQVLTDPDNLSEHGLRVAYEQKAGGALNRGDYNTSIAFAEKAFAIDCAPYDILLVHLAAALSGDLEKFNNASRIFRETLPKRYDDYKFQLASVEALALATSGQDAQARSLIERWAHMDRIEGRLRHDWRNYPGGNKVADNWKRLATK